MSVLGNLIAYGWDSKHHDDVTALLDTWKRMLKEARPFLLLGTRLGLDEKNVRGMDVFSAEYEAQCNKFYAELHSEFEEKLLEVLLETTSRINPALVDFIRVNFTEK